MTNTTTTVSVAEFARMVGRSRQSIHELIKRGKLTAIQGRIHPALGHAEFEANVRPRTTPGGPSSAVDDDEPHAASGYSAARAREVHARASLAELELARQRRSVMDAGEVLATVGEAGTLFRSTLSAWSGRLVPQIAALASDEHAIAACLTAECEHLLAQLSNKFAALAADHLDTHAPTA